MRRIITSALLLLLVSSLTVQAQKNNKQERRAEMKQRTEQRMGPRGTQQRGQEAMLTSLNLSSEQEVAIRAIMLDCKKETLPLNNELGEKKARLRTLSSADEYDVAALNNVVDEMSELNASIQKVNLAKKEEIRALLNDDQKILFDSNPQRGRQKRAVSK